MKAREYSAAPESAIELGDAGSGGGSWPALHSLATTQLLLAVLLPPQLENSATRNTPTVLKAATGQHSDTATLQLGWEKKEVVENNEIVVVGGVAIQ